MAHNIRGGEGGAAYSLVDVLVKRRPNWLLFQAFRQSIHRCFHIYNLINKLMAMKKSH